MTGWKKGQAVRLVPPSEATGRILEVYRDMQHVLGVPHISSFFQFLGTQPKFLDRFWTAVRPIVQSEAFFACAARLRADAYTRVQSNFEIPDLKTEIARQKFSPGACEELRDCIIFFCYAVPNSLLLAALLAKSLEGPAGNATVALTPAPTPRPHKRIVLVDEDTAAPAVKGIFADIRFSTEADVIHTVYRAFARWPDFLQAYWTGTKPITLSEAFHQEENAIREDAFKITAELPGPVELKASTLTEMGMNEVEISALVRITDMFVSSLSAAMLNVSVARIGLEGGQAKPKS